MSSVFENTVEPELERIPVLEVVHSEKHHGRKFQVHQTICRNVFTSFDRKLSRHLAATTGEGFPDFKTTVEVREIKKNGHSRKLSSASHSSVPHALISIAKRAFDRNGPVELIFKHGNQSETDPKGPRRTVKTDELQMLARALKVCRLLGETEFLDISGDFDILIVSPPGGLKPMTMSLSKGTVSVPGTGGNDMPFECPIMTFSEKAAKDPIAQQYLARARHALVAAKEQAIAEFRTAAEERILETNEALDGCALDGHRLTAVEGLVERLREGLGYNLRGLSEHARITALDWSADNISDSTAVVHVVAN